MGRTSPSTPSSQLVGSVDADSHENDHHGFGAQHHEDRCRLKDSYTLHYFNGITTEQYS